MKKNKIKRKTQFKVGTMVDVAQLVRAPGCGSGGRGFKSHLPPHQISISYLFELSN